MSNFLLATILILSVAANIIHVWAFSGYLKKKKIIVTAVLVLMILFAPVLHPIITCWFYRRFMPFVIGAFSVPMLFSFLFTDILPGITGGNMMFEFEGTVRILAWIAFIGLLSLTLPLFRPLCQKIKDKIPGLEQYALSSLLYIIPTLMLLPLPAYYTAKFNIDLMESGKVFQIMIGYSMIIIPWAILRFVKRIR